MKPLPTSLLAREKQRFLQPWIWALILIIAALSWSAAVVQLLFGRPFGGNPGPDWLVLLLLGVFGIGFPWLFLVLRLETGIGEEGIYVRFFPFHLTPRRFPWDEIQTIEAVTYRPILEYGGWGIRCGRTGRAYNVSGNRGIRLTLTNGKRLLIGSQDPERLLSGCSALPGLEGKIVRNIGVRS